MTTIAPVRTTPVGKADEEAIPRLARTLARAFEDDPAGRHFFPDDRTRLAGLERMFAELALPRMLPHHESYAAAGLAGGALWLPPGQTVAGPVETPRAFASMEEHRPHAPHYFLWLHGVDPDRQSEGIGSALMRPVLERADAEGVPAYLEATSTRNRALYERHGFELLRERRWPGGPPLYPMWREPAR
jgi:GNAT superfamily N-acetyltransferase